ncbi:glycogen biosynthesis protein GlgD [Oikeobacillus pervagus]|uniref:glycogen biosynthesis protein GlgD n=1 Tax=Oikeobacillus pervagus TaxID=1325931 RepID=UPI0027D7C740|nr:glycogen biosynthesis protein GlgD [Oikeobacillus pervagus]
MKRRSNQNNPEQKTKNGINPERYEFAAENSPVDQLKRKNAKTSQPVKSKQS